MTSRAESERARDRQPITVEQIVTRPAPSDPQVSPDGRRVAFVARPASKEGEHGEAAIWLLDVDGGEARQFSAGTWVDECPRWSPDGERIAFLSDRAERGKTSVYLVRADGGEARRVFDQQGEMASLSWSPDGRWLAVLFTEPETEAEKKRKEERDDARVWDADHKFRRLWVLDPDGDHAEAVSPAGRQVWGYAWSPDSARLALNVSETPRIDDLFRETEIAVVPRAGGEAASLARARGAAGDLVWSADGRYLAYLGPSGRVIHGEYVFRLSLDGGEPACLTPGYGGTAAHLQPHAGGDALLLVAHEGVNAALYRLDWDGTRRPLLAGEPWGDLYDPVTSSRDGSVVAAIWADGRTPPEVMVARVGGDAPGRLERRTALHPWLDGVALGATEIVRWESDPGVEVEGLLVLPVGYEAGRRYPLVVQVHGGPVWLWANGFYASWHNWSQLLAGRGYAVLMPNPRGSTGRGPAYTEAIFGDVGGGEYRDMIAGVDAMIARGVADPERLGIGGWSWGGYMTAWAITRTRRFKAAVMGAGVANLISDNSLGDIPSYNLSLFEASPYEDPDPYYERSPIRYARDVATPTLILHGEDDARVAPAQGRELYVALRSLGVETRFVTYPREGHSISERQHQRDLLNGVADWFDRHLAASR